MKLHTKTLSLVSALFALTNAVDASACPEREIVFGPNAFRFMEDHSGPVNYYRVVEEPQLSFIRARYEPPLKTAVLGVKVAEEDRPNAHILKWSWRATALPKGADECTSGKGDSAATVYVTWKRGLRWYTLKYVWSASAPVGSVCARKRNPFVAQDTVVLQSGGPLNEWKSQRVDLWAAFRKHFEDGDPRADVPDFGGIGIMSDGDQTGTRSGADFGKFVMSRDDCPK